MLKGWSCSNPSSSSSIGLKGERFREGVFDNILEKVSPKSVSFQLDLLLVAGFLRVEILHKTRCFAQPFGHQKPEPLAVVNKNRRGGILGRLPELDSSPQAKLTLLIDRYENGRTAGKVPFLFSIQRASSPSQRRLGSDLGSVRALYPSRDESI